MKQNLRLTALYLLRSARVTKEPEHFIIYHLLFTVVYYHTISKQCEVVAACGYDVARGDGCFLAEAIERTPFLGAWVFATAVGYDLMSYAFDFYDGLFHIILNFFNSFVSPNAAAPPRITNSTTPAYILVFCHHESGRGTSLMTG